MGERQAWSGPLTRQQPPCSAQCDIGGHQVSAAKRDVGGEAIVGRHEFDQPAFGVNNADAAGARQANGCHADIAAGLNCQTVKGTDPGRSVKQAPAGAAPVPMLPSGTANRQADDWLVSWLRR